jgi:hypothetical protein
MAMATMLVEYKARHRYLRQPSSLPFTSSEVRRLSGLFSVDPLASHGPGAFVGRVADGA